MRRCRGGEWFRGEAVQVIAAISLLVGLARGVAGSPQLEVVWEKKLLSEQSPYVRFSPDGELLATGTGVVRLWRARDGELLRTIEAGGKAVGLAFSPDGQLLAASGAGGRAGLWRVPDGGVVRTFPQLVVDAAFVAGGEMVATVNKDDRVHLWSVSNGDLLKTFQPSTAGFYPNLTVSPDGQAVALAAEGTRVWRISDGKLVRTIAPYRSWTVAFSPDGETLLTTDKNRVFLWRLADGALLHELKGHRWWVFGFAFTGDGKTLVTTSGDVQMPGKGRGEIHLWSVETGQLLRSYDPGAAVSSVALSPDGLLLAYGLRGTGSMVVARNPLAAGQ